MVKEFIRYKHSLKEKEKSIHVILYRSFRVQIKKGEKLRAFFFQTNFFCQTNCRQDHIYIGIHI